MIIFLIILILIIVVIARSVWKATDEDVYEEPEKESHVMPGADKETETGRASGTAKKSGERPSGDAAKRMQAWHMAAVWQRERKSRQRQRKKNGNLLSYIPITGEKIFGAVHTATEKICALIPCAMCAGRKKRSE